MFCRFPLLPSHGSNPFSPPEWVSWETIKAQARAFRPAILAPRSTAALDHRLTIARHFIGASAASPTLVVKTEICLYIWYVRILYIRLCAMQYFHIAVGSCRLLLKRQDRKAELSGSQCNRYLKTVRKGGTTSKTETEYYECAA